MFSSNKKNSTILFKNASKRHVVNQTYLVNKATRFKAYQLIILNSHFSVIQALGNKLVRKKGLKMNTF